MKKSGLMVAFALLGVLAGAAAGPAQAQSDKERADLAAAMRGPTQR